LYPIYDVTASGLSSTWLFATPNNNRIEGPIMENHFGMLTINWKLTDPTIKMEIWDVSNNQRIEHTVKLSELSFKK
jgi:alkaline phosphatase D